MILKLSLGLRKCQILNLKNLKNLQKKERFLNIEYHKQHINLEKNDNPDLDKRILNYHPIKFLSKRIYFLLMNIYQKKNLIKLNSNMRKKRNKNNYVEIL